MILGKNKKKGGEMSDEEFDDSKSTVSNPTTNTLKTPVKPNKKKKG